MRKKRRIGILLIITSLIIVLLPVPEADAASSASDFVIDGETLKKYKGTEKNVTVPDQVEIIGEGAFQENVTVEQVTLPNSVKKIEAYAFWGCDKLKTVSLGKGLTEVGDMAFNNCTGLEYITIPSNVRRIGISAFAYCQRLESIAIPPEVTDIREDAFDGDYLLNIRCEEGSYADKYAKDFYERQKEMPVYARPDDGDDSDGDNGGGSSDNIYETPGDILGSTHVVGNQAVVLMQSSGLNVMGGNPGNSMPDAQPDQAEADLSAILAGLGNAGGTLWQVPERAFYRNGTLEEAELAEGILEIAPFAYARSSLSRITLPQGLKKIDYAAFYHCDSLMAVELPDTVTEVAPKAFAYTAWVQDFLSASEEPFLISGGVLVAYRGSAEEIAVPEGVRVIAGEAFAGHSELKRITLPESLQAVGERAFEGCGLESVDYKGTALSEELLEERVSLADMSAAPVKESGFRWTWGLAVVLLLAGSLCTLSRTRKG